MNTADKIGLLWGFGWIADNSFLWTLFLCLLITPMLHLLVGVILEDRIVPLRPSRQFLSFFPGDIFLGFSATFLLVAAQDLAAQDRWFNQWWVHVILLIVTISAALLATLGELREGIYPRDAVFSPTKLYHNFVLYGGYGYVMLSTFLAVAWGARSWMLVWAIVFFLAWLVLLVVDKSSPRRLICQRAAHAHVADWAPVWASPNMNRGW